MERLRLCQPMLYDVELRVSLPGCLLWRFLILSGLLSGFWSVLILPARLHLGIQIYFS
jgi:hypothetical protein